MSKRIAALLVIVLIAGAMGMAFAAGTPGTWTGTVTDKMCATKGVSLHDADCAKKCVAAGDKYASAGLTRREWEVLELLAQECSTAQIAGKLVLSASAVRVHIASIVHKLEVTDRTAAARAFSQRSRT